MEGIARDRIDIGLHARAVVDQVEVPARIARAFEAHDLERRAVELVFRKRSQELAGPRDLELDHEVEIEREAGSP